MAKLNDTQTILLSAASQRSDGNFYPLPEGLTGQARTAKAVAALLKNGLAEEREAGGTEPTHRHDDDIAIGLFVTPAGLSAIGIGDVSDDAGAVPPTVADKPVSKRELVVDLLTRDGGATTAELIEAAGWLPHTVRAALTGLRKQGHTIVRGKRADATCYSITTAA